MAVENSKRIIQLSKQDNIILFGPRDAGKSTLLKHWLNANTCLWIDLPLPRQEARYSRDPELLLAEVEGIPATQSHVVIDEIQKVPKLLDIVHYLIENTDKHFILTGSSAHKIKYASSNLLAGRHAHKKGTKNKALSEHDQRINKTKSRVRVRVERIVGSITNEQGGLYSCIMVIARNTLKK